MTPSISEKSRKSPSSFLRSLGLLAVTLCSVQTATATLSSPIEEIESNGVLFRVFEEGPVRIVTVTPSNISSPTFMSFIKTTTAFTEDEIAEFLTGFAVSINAEWELVDPSVPLSTLKFFLEAPSESPEKMEKVVTSSANPQLVKEAWVRLSEDPLARQEAEYFMNVIQSQRRMWVDSGGKYIAVWSQDGKSLGVGTLPITR
jgi:hypothetical protein